MENLREKLKGKKTFGASLAYICYQLLELFGVPLEQQAFAGNAGGSIDGIFTAVIAMTLRAALLEIAKIRK